MATVSGTLTIASNDETTPYEITLSANTRYPNAEQSCPEGYTGDVVAAGTVYGDTQEEADTAAEALLECAPLSFPLEANSSVFSIVQQSDGMLIAGGAFTNLGSSVHDYIIRFTEPGVIDETFVPVFNNSVSLIRLLSNGKILCCGSFTTVNGVSKTRICVLNTDGSLDGFNGSLTFSAFEDQNDVIELYNGDILIGGNGILTRLDSTGSTVAWVDENDFTGGHTHALLAIGQDVYVGGGFTDYAGGANTNGLVKFNDAGVRDTGFNCTFTGGTNGGPNRMTVASDGNIVCCGNFTTVNGTAMKCVAKINPTTGGLVAGFNNPDVGTGDNRVNYALELDDGRFVLLGTFDDIANTARDQLGCINANGSISADWDVGTWSPGNVSCPPFVLQSGMVLIGCVGSASGGQTIGAETRNGFAKFNVDGTLLPLI